MQIFDDFNELYKKFTFVTYDPLNPEDVVSIQFDLTEYIAINYGGFCDIIRYHVMWHNLYLLCFEYVFATKHCLL